MAAPRPEHLHASALLADATPTPRPPHPRQQDGGKTNVLSSANGPSTVVMQQRCHHTSASVRSPSWPSETQGWWYVPAEEVLGRTCKSCHAFRALEDFTGNKRKKTVPGICLGCKTEDYLASTQRGSGSEKMGPRKRIALISEDSTLRRSARAQGLERVNYHEGAERECCLLVLNLVSSTLPCIRRPRPRLRVLDVCGFV